MKRGDCVGEKWGATTKVKMIERTIIYSIHGLIFGNLMISFILNRACLLSRLLIPKRPLGFTTTR